MLKKLLNLVVCSSFICTACNVMAQLEGTWQGKLVTAPGSELTVQFIFESQPDGGYAMLVNSPDSGAIKNVPASNVTFDESNLSVEVADLEGSFKGKLQDGSLKGHWSQLGESYPFELTPFVEQALSQELLEKVVGRWQGGLEVPGGSSLSIVMIFSVTESGLLTGTMESPDQSPRKFDMGNIVVTESGVSLVVEVVNGSYKGEFSGDDIKGHWSQGSELALTLSRAAYDPRENALELAAEVRAKLLGPWHGTIATPGGSLAVVFRFVQEEEDLVRGFFDSPDQGAKDLIVKSVSVEDGQVDMSIAGIGSYKGSMDSGKITGDFSQAGQKMPLTIMKGLLPSLKLEIPAQSAVKLVGTWHGELSTPQGKSTLTVRFERDSDEFLVGFLDNPDRAMQGARISVASLTDGKLSFESSMLRLRYSGTVQDDEVKGTLSVGGRDFELTLARGR
jgi:hypothetical protein|tara:strand:+ start:1197 stop:2543 length:1347 start_codon:yes stop_codon:yes gene_type:complete